ncbi:hypothetical protein B296_00025200 [Ensete ventricosum]|uniref:Tubby C-terminal domain-containing protein n=1 Tax=Ensete ventricosum TaxID=4639 RepID=A0A426Z0F3_ENSVE|nr:hypothetical protein B296_00025200 [Ensete ventricosum]
MEATRGEKQNMKAVEDRAGGGERKGGLPREVFPELCSPAPVRLTVWCKSLLFNSHGYTVYDDADGRMVFRVDNYAHNRKQETVLMDRGGHVLLTIRRCRKVSPHFSLSLSLSHIWPQELAISFLSIMWIIADLSVYSQILNLTESWEAYKGDKDVQRMVREQRPLFKATKDLGSHSCTISMFPEDGVKPLGYRMSWSREKEWSKIYQAAATSPVAEVLIITST